MPPEPSWGSPPTRWCRVSSARSLPAVLDDLRAHAPGVDILVVNDGSTDATSAVARAHGARVVDLPINLGIGGAVQTGLLFALRGGYAVAFQFDGDGQHLAAEAPHGRSSGS